MTNTHTPGPLATRQGTKQETYAGPWVVSYEGSPVIKRELRFVEDDAPAGWELLGGDCSQVEALLAENEQLRAEVERLTRERDESDRSASNAQALRAFAARVAEFFSRDDPPFSSVHPLAAEARRLIGGAS